MKLKKKLGSALMIGMSVIMLSTNSVYAEGEHDGRLTDRVQHSSDDFEDYQYEHLKEADFDAIIDGLEDLAQDSANDQAVLQVIVDMEEFYTHLDTMYCISYIKGDLVADDQYWDDEVKYNDEIRKSIYDKIMTSYKTIALSTCSDVLHDRIDDEDEWQAILDYVEMTDEQKELFKQETELTLQYDILYNKEYKTTVGNTQYTFDELDEEYDKGNVGYTEFLQGYADILNQKNEEMGALFLELVEVRDKIADTYGYDNYADYAYENVFSRDYSYDDLAAYRQSIKDDLLPLYDELLSELYIKGNVDVSELIEQKMDEQTCRSNLRKFLPEISSDLLLSLDYMEAHSLSDLSVNDKKAPGGYTISLCDKKAPFIYNDADGTFLDMRTLIHEFGHYNQMYYQTEDTWRFDSSDIDIAEIHSQGMEILFMDYADDIYGDEYGHAMNLFDFFQFVAAAAVGGAKEDEFQYRLYAEADGLTLERLNELYYEVCKDYSGKYAMLSSDGMFLSTMGYLPSGQCPEWVLIPHTFQAPVYYISYSVSVAAVFELFDKILDDRDEGIETYLGLVDAEYQDSFQDTLVNAGLNNPIANPRFDVYAQDIRYYLGMDDHRLQSEDDGGTTVVPGEDDDDEDDTDTTESVDGEEDEDTEDEDEEDEEDTAVAAIPARGVSMVMILLIIVALGIIAGFAVLIVLLAKGVPERSGKAKKGALPPAGGMRMPTPVNMPNPGINPGVNPGMNSFVNPGMNRPAPPVMNPGVNPNLGVPVGSGYTQQVPFMQASPYMQANPFAHPEPVSPGGQSDNPYFQRFPGNAALSLPPEPGAPVITSVSDMCQPIEIDMPVKGADNGNAEMAGAAADILQAEASSVQQEQAPAEMTDIPQAYAGPSPAAESSVQGPAPKQTYAPEPAPLNFGVQNTVTPVQSGPSNASMFAPVNFSSGAVGPHTEENPFLKNLERMKKEEEGE